MDNLKSVVVFKQQYWLDLVTAADYGPAEAIHANWRGKLEIAHNLVLLSAGLSSADIDIADRDKFCEF